MGGGVATGDLNNDGLPELFFTGNMIENRLYLNLGGLNFKDITIQANVAGDSRWMTGVTMADVNSDGLLDIYVSVAGPDSRNGWGNPKENLLYINQGADKDGVPIFKELAKEYGLDDVGQSVQGTFFDYDLDGDLDLYVANYPIMSFKSPSSYYRNQMDYITSKNSDHLYRNEGNNTFTDVTEQAGLLSYGLSLSATVGDFDQNGYPDLYVSNDFASPDYFYFNNGDGTFDEKSKELTNHTSFYGMGVDIADFNNDGLLDIVQMDMTPEDNRRSKANMASMDVKGFRDMVDLGLHHQYMKNSLQVNNGMDKNGFPVFSDISYLAGIAATDWSWGGLFADLDNDGFKDLFVTNGSRRDINNKDYFTKLKKSQFNAPYAGMLGKKPPLLEFVKNMPSERLDNYTFRNNGDLSFSKSNEDWGIQFEGFSNGVAYADLDADGDLELIVNNIDDDASIFENLSSDKKVNNFIRFKLAGTESNPFGLGAKITIEHKGEVQFVELTLTRGFQSSVEPIVHFGLGKSTIVEKAEINWPDGKRQMIENLPANQLVKIKYSDAAEVPPSNSIHQNQMFSEISKTTNIEFAHNENQHNDYEKEVLLPYETSKLGPGLAIGDVNGDLLDDFYIGGAQRSSGALYIQQKSGEFRASNEVLFQADRNKEDTGAVFFDANGDGSLDLYVASGGNESKQSEVLQDRLYINDGLGNFSITSGVLPIMSTSGGCVAPNDFDGDGDIDLFIGGRLIPGQYPESPRSYLLINETDTNGNLVFRDVTAELAKELLHPGLVTSAVWVDFDKDNRMDLVIAGEWMPIMFFRNSDDGFENFTEKTGISDAIGWWSSLAADDFDKDGDIDLIAGNLGLNYKYKATEKETFDIYLDDFDDNGQKDIVLSYYYNGDQFPVRGLQCSSEQIPEIKDKFENFDDFAIATVSDIYTTRGLRGSLHYSATTFASSYVENKGDGTFELRALPNEAQVSSVNGIVIKDFNGDGRSDILLAGNFFVSEVETPRNDASVGLVLLGDHAGNFVPVSPKKSGFFAHKDTRAMGLIKSKTNDMVILANNNDSPQFFKIN